MQPGTSWWERLTKVSLTSKGLQQASARLVSEAEFHKLLAEEMLRSEQSGDHYRVLIIYTSTGADAMRPMERELSHRLMAVLSTSLRKTDHVGWYREGTLMGALLTEMGPEVVRGPHQILLKRLNAIFQRELPDAFDVLRIHLCTQEEARVFNVW